jgi:hypothetical protein
MTVVLAIASLIALLFCASIISSLIEMWLGRPPKL